MARVAERTFDNGVSANGPARRVIAHVDADAFYASVHLLEDPSLAGKPVVVAGRGARSIVTTANYEARTFGIGSAQPAARARQLCPHATFLTPDFDLYRRYSKRAMTIMRAFCDTIEPLSLDEAYLDITQAPKPIAHMRAMIEEIQRETGLQYSVGIGPNKLCAKVLSDYRKPAAFNVASREQCIALFAACSPRLIPGIGPKTVASLEAVGITTVSGIRDAAPGVLEQAFSQRRCDELRARARFEHDGVVESHRETKSVSEETTFDEDVSDIEELVWKLGELTAELCTRLETKQLRGRTIGIKVRLDDWTNVTRARTIDEHTRDQLRITELATQLLRDYDPPRPVRLLGVRVASFDREASESELPQSLWEQLQIPQLRRSGGPSHSPELLGADVDVEVFQQHLQDERHENVDRHDADASDDAR
ncbi:MAG: DNA-directed polymerase [Thermoleophilia bacterium]|nr:DNA-directed polymerase [Thermoleophilia bacterium]